MLGLSIAVQKPARAIRSRIGVTVWYVDGATGSFSGSARRWVNDARITVNGSNEGMSAIAEHVQSTLLQQSHTPDRPLRCSNATKLEKSLTLLLFPLAY